MTTEQIVGTVEGLLGDKDTYVLNYNENVDLVAEIKKITTRLPLSVAGISVNISDKERRITFNRIEGAVPRKEERSGSDTHTYIVPKISKDFLKVLTDKASHLVWLTGPTQCGKDRMVHYAGRKLGRKVYQINCRGDMGSDVFLGSKTVVIDTETKQNKMIFMKGIVEQAMIEGLDEDGKEIGPPGILFITEIASMPERVGMSMNRLFESDDPIRTLVIDVDGGRVVKSHSGLRIVVAANTTGRGAVDLESTAYTAQTDALDISLLNRFSACFRMGYDKKVERNILAEKIGDDSVVSQLIKYRDAIRSHIRSGELSSPFSTGHLVHIADMYRVFGSLGKAIYYVLFEFLMPEEKPIYNEQSNQLLGVDIIKENIDTNIDYM